MRMACPFHNAEAIFLCAVLIDLGLISKNESAEYNVYQLIPEAINNLEKFLNIHTEK